jgi:RNA polymerase sigma factor (sigma-70 family)
MRPNSPSRDARPNHGAPGASPDDPGQPFPPPPCCDSPPSAPEESVGSVTCCLINYQEGDREAMALILQRYFERLVRLARKRLQASGGRLSAATDEEDIAQSVLVRLADGLDKGRFPRLEDRSDLWRILIHLTGQRVIDKLRHDRTASRGGGRLRTEAELLAASDSGDQALLDRLVGDEPSPEVTAVLAEESRLRLDSLRDPKLVLIARRTLEGFSTREIAAELGCAQRTVQNKLDLIRSRWGFKAEAAS